MAAHRAGWCLLPVQQHHHRNNIIEERRWSGTGDAHDHWYNTASLVRYRICPIDLRVTAEVAHYMRSTFSTTTMASSTVDRCSTIANMVKVLTLKVPISTTSTAIVGINVARKFAGWAT